MAALITIGSLVKAGAVSRDDVVALARTMFDGRREQVVNGIEIVIPKFDSLTTRHGQCLDQRRQRNARTEG